MRDDRDDLGAGGQARCRWCAAAPDLILCHDNERGFPVDDDHRLFEKLCLEGFQSGLSWRTILAKRENFRSVFLGFDFLRIARLMDADNQRLLQNPGIVRHRGKIAARWRVATDAEDQGPLSLKTVRATST
uniref:DNA-3-methyladenine glycosylase I n=1 Tax=Rhizobium sp. F40D2 TaxID=3453141 RepID=UPI003F262C94